MDESKRSELSLLPEEAEFLESLEPPAIRSMLALHSRNLAERRKEVVGVRAEDILFLLRWFQERTLEVTGGPIRAKLYLGGRYFLNPHPESDALRKRPDLVTAMELLPTDPRDFRGIACATIGTYGNVGSIAAIHRRMGEIIFSNRASIFSHLSDLGHTDDESGPDDKMFLETVYQRLAVDAKDLQGFNPPFVRRAHVLEALKNHLTEAEKHELLKFMQQASRRACILVAFNEEIFDHDVSASSEHTHVRGELTLRPRDGRLPTNVILGFESIGDWEDSILDYLRERVS